MNIIAIALIELLFVGSFPFSFLFSSSQDNNNTERIYRLSSIVHGNIHSMRSPLVGFTVRGAGSDS